jgi:tripartite-type tricarboxylate transporter receptor subunit TctC
LQSPALYERFFAAGLTPLGGSPEEFSELIQREIPKRDRVVREAKIPVE